ncbi:ectoine synthase [Acidocella aminolytica]|jgi:L-ectoine synthase|uniref:L-ectoine synthase n=1 Tax=Acidocella aminolytica 101 = DSM 11237 TaxID=1120923 RepID=A0A0D6PAZ7_9PROT|nr:ectoine synthase [Acidocella aminolytica]GAN78827.1 ectoine synthase [Acidocella aminolytica 101 = DSM 11237]GBQ33273.1 L-ectoine synthase [Acidocella aminolytica 101 = DSM 11237]SHF17674.1 ectoine synthase [Acidocella aminolytica 101 = DSM 11237]
MIIRNIDEASQSERKVKTDGWDSVRMLLKDDGMGFSFHITTMYAGKTLQMHYKNHYESVYVLSGEGTIEDLGTGEIHELRPGVLYVLNKHDRHIVRPRTDIVTACVFNPPVTGKEVHDETGAYPSEAEMAQASA